MRELRINLGLVRLKSEVWKELDIGNQDAYAI
jgi:hypothetical protein